MGLSGVVETQTEIKSDGDLFHEIFGGKLHQMRHAASEHVQNIELHEGDWGTPGSIILWHYNLGGKYLTAKEVIEFVDEPNKHIGFKVFEGDIMNYYKSFKIDVKVVPQGETNIIKWKIEYEKLNEDVQDPNHYLDFAIVVTKAIESHHLTNA
ncbi:Bet v I/Major latex protein [Dillenia turbinata]|uniref:Bet v I/Major latex protein n=1 Tax=Dillenia turbinata TaxID=194707 RepID=A0AAN8ZAI1_9MAGN